MRRWAILLYGIGCYLIFFCVFLYSIGFMAGVGVPKSIDSGHSVPIWAGFLVNTGLLGLFALQHSAMARPAFKRQWTKVVPKEAERSTYVLFSSLAMIVLFLFWQPMPGELWRFENPALRGTMYALFLGGWATIFYATCLINHFDLFGLRQVWLQFRGQAYTPIPFKIPGAYRFVRHPLYIGWLMAVWFTPTMTFSHWFFAMGVTAYILIAIQFEEKDLVDDLGDAYRDYQRSVPMLLPRRKRMERGEQQAPARSSL